MNACKAIYHTTNVARIRSFQYRLLQSAIVTNKQLFKWKIKDNPLCTFCQEEEETILHLFVDCSKVKHLWDQIKKLLESEYESSPKLDRASIILNKINKSDIGGFIVLLTKMYIYRKRCQNEGLNFIELKQFIDFTRNKEKYIAIKNNNIVKHDKKWGTHTGNTYCLNIVRYFRDNA